MTREEYESITYQCEPDLFKISMLENQSDRILIHGYTLERNSFDVYIEHGRINRVIYNFKNEIINKISEDDFDSGIEFGLLIPDKRVYPAKSDFEFCKLCISKGYFIPFTTFED